MLIVADEDVDAGIVRALREDGFEVRYIAEASPSMKDPSVLATAIELNALLITQDKGFGRLVRRYGMPSGGVVLVRLIGWSSKSKAESVRAFFKDYGHTMQGTYAVLEPGRTRTARWP
ncbi:MAG: DUF5615 family PIN-like protein [Flavobacteriales bacterium]